MVFTYASIVVVCAIEMILTGGTLLGCEGEGCHVDDVLLSRDKAHSPVT